MAVFPTWLFSQVSVLLVRFTEGGAYRASLYPLCWQRGEVCLTGGIREWDDTAPPQGLEKHPLLVLVCGQGVICKPLEGSEGLVGRVEADAERFAWSRYREDEDAAGECFCFVQRTQVAPLLERLEGLPLVDVRYVPAPTEEQAEATAARRAGAFFRDDLSWRKLLHPSPQGALLGSMLSHRLRLPVLAGVLLLLVGNYLAGERIGERRSQLQQELSLLESRRGRQQQLSEQKRELLKDFAQGIPCRYSLLCDRIGAAVPPAVTLFSLEVQPLRKEPAEGTPLELAQRTVRLTGVCLRAEAATELAGRLGLEAFTRELSLARLEQDSRDGLLHFAIDLQL